jgi:CYTH domain-containing protein
MHYEIERKFLVRKDLWYALNKPEGEDILQGYLLSEPSITIRVRSATTKSCITIKGPSLNISRAEYEFSIPGKDANEILSTFTRSTIEKTRYRIGFEGKIWEVDEFFGDNEGLIIAEIELDNENEIFMHPKWVGEEVTMDERYKNAYLANHPYKNW